MSSGPQGLTTPDAEARLLRHGPNALEDTTQRAGLRLLLRQFASPLVLILVFGAVVSLVVGDWIDAAIILAIVLGSTLLGFSQEFRASRAVAELRQRLALTVRVRRDGRLQTLEAGRLVPGDVIELAAGNLVPADGLILDSRDLLVSEASLTGESMPVEKQPGVARERIRIQNPCFLPDDEAIVQHAAHRNFHRLLASGVRIFEYQKCLLHQKVMSVDGIRDAKIAQRLEEIFESDCRHCVELDAAGWQQRGAWHRAKDNLLHAFNELM